MSRQGIILSLSVLAACCTVFFCLSRANSNQSTISLGKPDVPHTNKDLLASLGGGERYLTFISTDKPIYKIGEKIYVKGVILNAKNHNPLPKNSYTNANIEIKGPKGERVAGGTVQAQESVWSFAWDIPEGQAGGEYKVRVSYPWEGHAPAERKFDIRAYRAPRLKSQITFLRDGYAPGETVNATLDVKRAEGGVPVGARVSVIANIDGVDVRGKESKVDDNGLCAVSFVLPNEIAKGEGTLALVVEDGGVVETASKTIPILLQTVDLQIFPESGELVSGYKNRVYIQAKQPNGKPADIVGKLFISPALKSEQIVNVSASNAIAEFHTEHEGRGRFEFVPEANKDYYLAISEPGGIKTKYKLPKVQNYGAVIHSDKNIYEKGQAINLQVGCTSNSYRVTLSKREEEIAAYKVDNDKQASDDKRMLYPVAFTPQADIDGVLTVTVWNDKNIPVAERLIYLQAASPLNISIKADKKNYVPGDQAEITVKATDSEGKPVEALVGLTVTDDSILEMVEKRDQAPNLPVMVYLEPEVQDLADAHVYLDPKNPKAALATDLLLATQGWRKFALVDLTKFVEEHGDQARRAVALRIQAKNEIAEAVRMQGGFGGAPGAWEGADIGGVLAFQQNAARPNAHHVQFAAAVPPAAPVAAAFPALPASDLAPAQDAQLDMLAKGDLARNVKDKDAGEKQFIAKAERANIQINERQRDFVENKLQKAIMQADQKRRADLVVCDEEMSPQTSNLAIVREFAYKVRENRKATDRVDFTETLYWNAGVKTDPKTGEAKINFGLNDSVSTFRVFADAFTETGEIGADKFAIESVQPFYTEAKLPLEVTAGDKILLPINLVNASQNSLSSPDINIDLKGDFKLASLVNNSTSIAPGERTRCLQTINVGFGNGFKEFVLNAKAGPFEDKVQRTLSVKPKGFPMEIPFGGLIAPGQKITHKIIIPETIVPESISSSVAIYPTPLANLTEALERMIQDPCGCFEQTSSTSYPLTMAQQYFLSHTGVNPKLVETSKQKLDVGYKMLVGFWCPDKGYEWFGENPGHEALTAFGLLHFTDMSKVREVDQNMVASTRAWLMKQKDGQGGFNRKRRALHTWIEDKDCSNAYILWSLLETGESAQNLQKEIDSLKQAAAISKNTYVIALAANVLYLAGEKAEAKKLMDKLVTKQKVDGSLSEITASIVGSSGESLEVEGTSFATLAWLRDPQYVSNVEKSIKFLADSCKAGRYGSTQATVLALRSIVTYDKSRAKPKAAGRVRVSVDGQAVGDWQDFTPSTEGSIKLPDISELLTPGEHRLELQMENGSEMPYSMAVKYNAITPASSKECKLDIELKMAHKSMTEGAATEAKIVVTNKTKDVLPTPVAIVGIPGGLEPRHDQLKELVKKHTIDAYEIRGREVVLYWRTLASEASVEVPISLIAAIPGTYTGPASRAYLYYTDEHKKWIDGAQIEIAAK